VEFGGVQLWNPPLAEGKPPSGQIALRFRKPRLIYFLTLSESEPADWPDKLQRDEVDPFNVAHEQFTLTAPEQGVSLMSRAREVRPMLGTPGTTPLPGVGEVFACFDCHSVGLIVAASSMSVVAHHGELDESEVVAANRKWWEYWKDYWNLRDTDKALPRDFACEVTIPAG
jgi:hypothetical protein